MELLEEAARQLYREWFVRLRFPGREHTRIINGMPEGWERTSFEKALVLQRGFDLPDKREKKETCRSMGRQGSTGLITSKGSRTGRCHWTERYTGRSSLRAA